MPATNRSVAGNINVKFSEGTTDDTLNGYKVNPAFYWGGWDIPASGVMSKQEGGTELTGIWVGKFESSYNSGKIRIKSGYEGWFGLTVDGIFTYCKNMNIASNPYGITSAADTHMLKNSEWGAVAYLSKYTLDSIGVSLTLNDKYITAHNIISEHVNQSTTQNEYGIYDLKGCYWECMAAYVNNSYADDYGNSLYIADTRYKDVFPVGVPDNQSNNYSALKKAYGHGIYETSGSYTGSTGWLGNYSTMPYDNGPYLSRGGAYYNGENCGLFCFSRSSGDVGTYTVFRVATAIP